MGNNERDCDLGRKLIIQVAVLFASLLFSVQAFAGAGGAVFIFTGSVTNPAGATPMISLSLEWTDANAGGAFRSATVSVTLAPGDSNTIVATKVAAALAANATIAGAFLITTASKGGTFGFPLIEFVNLSPNPGISACMAAVMNGTKTGTPPTLANQTTGLGTSAGLDPTSGSVFFDVEGSPTGGAVEFAANGIVVSVTTDGKSISDIEDALARGLRDAGLESKVDTAGRIVVTNVTVDNLLDVGLRGSGRLDSIGGGASFYVTDPGVGVTSFAAQRCPAFVPAEPSRIPKIYYLLIIVLLLTVMGFVALWVRRRSVKS
jgi:hypothetical protein